MSPWGLQWEKKDDDKEVARRALNLLEDRRMLWADFSREIEEHCVRSAEQARRDIGVLIDNPEISKDLAKQLKAMRTLFRTFMDDVGSDDPWGRHHRPSCATDPLSLALGRLRAMVGLHIADLASRFDLEISDDLASIVPNEGDWFFERFA